MPNIGNTPNDPVLDRLSDRVRMAKQAYLKACRAEDDASRKRQEAYRNLLLAEDAVVNLTLNRAAGHDGYGDDQ